MKKPSPVFKSQSSGGFTVVELLIVVVVIAILAAVTVVAYNGLQNKAKNSASLSNAVQAGKKISVYSLANAETLPVTIGAAGLASTADVTYQYTINNNVTPNTFCLTAASGSSSAHIVGTTTGLNTATYGPCASHTGNAPTALADGSSCPTGYIVVPGSSLYNTKAFCVMKYEAKNDGSGVAVSTTTGTPWVSISQTDALATSTAACTGCHLIREAEWMTIAQNVLAVPSNWTSGAVGTGSLYTGHNDNTPANFLSASIDSDGYYGTGQTTGSNQRRTLTLSNGEVIWDFSGDVWEWTQGTTDIAGNQPAPSGLGYAWRSWATALPGKFAYSFPKYSLVTAASWDATQGMGNIYTSSTEAAQRSLIRGGGWYNGVDAGVFSIYLDATPSSADVILGFRVAR